MNETKIHGARLYRVLSPTQAAPLLISADRYKIEFGVLQLLADNGRLQAAFAVGTWATCEEVDPGLVLRTTPQEKEIILPH